MSSTQKKGKNKEKDLEQQDAHLTLYGQLDIVLAPLDAIQRAVPAA